MGYKRRKKLDGRTKEARRIASIEKLIRSDLDAASIQILERDIAYLSFYSEQLLAGDIKSKSTKSLPGFLKCHTALKGAILSLRNIRGSKPRSQGLASLLSDEDADE